MSVRMGETGAAGGILRQGGWVCYVTVFTFCGISIYTISSFLTLFSYETLYRLDEVSASSKVRGQKRQLELTLAAS